MLNTCTLGVATVVVLHLVLAARRTAKVTSETGRTQACEYHQTLTLTTTKEQEEEDRMNALQRIAGRTASVRSLMTTAHMSTGEKGSGAGKGGGAGGSVTESGGAMGKRGAAQEEQYFRKQLLQQLDALKKQVKDLQDTVEKTDKK